MMDLIRAFIEAVIVRELGFKLPPNSQVTKLHMHPLQPWQVEYITT